MSYETDCPCGKVLTVQAADAGAKMTCPACGRELEVPSLRQLRRLDPPPPPPPRPPVDYAFLRMPGVIIAVCGLLWGCGSGLYLGMWEGANSPALRSVPALLSAATQIVGVALVCVSKRLPVVACVILPAFGVCGLIAAMLVPERLPPVPLPPRE